MTDEPALQAKIAEIAHTGRIAAGARSHEIFPASIDPEDGRALQEALCAERARAMLEIGSATVSPR